MYRTSTQHSTRYGVPDSRDASGRSPHPLDVPAFPSHRMGRGRRGRPGTVAAVSVPLKKGVTQFCSSSRSAKCTASVDRSTRNPSCLSSPAHWELVDFIPNPAGQAFVRRADFEPCLVKRYHLCLALRIFSALRASRTSVSPAERRNSLVVTVSSVVICKSSFPAVPEMSPDCTSRVVGEKTYWR